jgi:Ran GTPase-activating protein (RanGAP) involved in mRNA processing and transport
MLQQPDQTVWDCKTNYIGPEVSFKILLECIEANEWLKEINLSSNFLTTENIRCLVDVLIQHPAITTVRLNDNRLYIDAGKDLIRLARKNRRITVIETEDTRDRNNNKIPARFLGAIQSELLQNHNK